MSEVKATSSIIAKRLGKDEKYDLEASYSKMYDSFIIKVKEGQGITSYQWSLERVPMKVATELYKILGQVISESNINRFEHFGKHGTSEKIKDLSLPNQRYKEWEKKQSENSINLDDKNFTKFDEGGSLKRTRRTKEQIRKDNYNKEVDAYQWYVVNLEEKKAISGFEYKEDALDLLLDYDRDKNFKVASKSSLKKLGIENPNESWKYQDGGYMNNVYAGGGGISDWYSYPNKKVKGMYSVKGHGVDVVVPITEFEKLNNDFYFIYPDFDNRDFFKGIKVRSSALNSLDKGKVVMAETDKGVKVKIQRIGNLKFHKGGAVSNFEKLSNKVAKNYVGKTVATKYRRKYGKTYSEKEAHEVGNKVAGMIKKSMRPHEMAFGHFFKSSPMSMLKEKFPDYTGQELLLKNGDYVKVFDQAGSKMRVINLDEIGSGVTPRIVDVSEVSV